MDVLAEYRVLPLVPAARNKTRLNSSIERLAGALYVLPRGAIKNDQRADWHWQSNDRVFRSFSQLFKPRLIEFYDRGISTNVRKIITRLRSLVFGHRQDGICQNVNGDYSLAPDPTIVYVRIYRRTALRRVFQTALLDCLEIFENLVLRQSFLNEFCSTGKTSEISETETTLFKITFGPIVLRNECFIYHEKNIIFTLLFFPLPTCFLLPLWEISQGRASRSFSKLSSSSGPRKCSCKGAKMSPSTYASIRTFRIISVPLCTHRDKRRAHPDDRDAIRWDACPSLATLCRREDSKRSTPLSESNFTIFSSFFQNLCKHILHKACRASVNARR